MSKLPGITREEEEQKLAKTIRVAEEKVRSNRDSIKKLAEELHAMQEEFDESDKEAQTLWHDTDARFKFVNQDLKRAEQARKKPYFGRIDFKDKKLNREEAYYIGRSVIADRPDSPEVIDWRAPIASVYYDAALGDVSYSVKGEGRYDITLMRKRTYEIQEDRLKDFYDSDVVANDELLTKYLARSKRAVLGEIIATIQQEQNAVIRKKPQHNLIIQGAAGSGKTTVAMHRISYILYNYEQEFAPEDFYVIGSNQVLLNYITGVLPELNVYGVSQMTMEQLFIRLLYEDWDKHQYSVHPVQRGITPPVKGTLKWFGELESFCDVYEEQLIPRQDVVIEKNGIILLSAQEIQSILVQCRKLSRADKISRLTEYLMSRLENEISGKYYSYTNGEKKNLQRRMENHFGRREWKGSIFELYTEFLQCQNEKGMGVPVPDKSFDVYDLAALAYLYKRIKEDQIIREAGHVVIDEAQDFGMMVYCALKYCLSKCTYTIMGDVSQNISLDYGLNDWSELRRLMLPGEFDYFGLLRKSYRNTVEISQFATDILYHGSFQIYPVEPIIRHGEEVRVEQYRNFEGLLENAQKTVEKWQQDGMETIAIVCADEAEVSKVAEGLKGHISCLSTVTENLQFSGGVMVLSLEYTKGLEFDAVLIFDASNSSYPYEDGYVKRLYVAATRALHRLVVQYQGKLTELIATPVDESRRKNAVLKVQAKAPKFVSVEPELTNEQIYRRIATEGEQERRRREMYGPRKIEISPEQRKQGTDREKMQSRETARTFVQQGLESAAGGGSRRERGAGSGRNPYIIPSYLERWQKELEERNAVSADRGEFGEMPENNSLTPAGHGRIDSAIKFHMKGTGYVDLYSGYGTLRIMPLAPDVVRICFAKGQCSTFPEAVEEYKRPTVKARIRENSSIIEIYTECMTVRVDKKSGVLSFVNAAGKVVLTEQREVPRQVGDHRVWEFFDWKKDENLIARGVGEKELIRLGSSAKYISYGPGNRKMPGLAGQKGYELLFPPAIRTLCCTIPMYGYYLCQENTVCIDYYVKIK